MSTGDPTTGGACPEASARSHRGRSAVAIGASAVAAISMMVVVFATGTRPAEGTPARRSPIAAAQVDPIGEAVFIRQCAGCHGPSAEGAIGPDLRLWAGTTDELATIVANGADGMPAFAATLLPEQIDAVAAYVVDLVGTTDYLDRCATCHGPDGSGGVGPSLKTSRRTDEERRSIVAIGSGSMPGFEDEFDPDELDALVWRTAGYQQVGSTLFGTHCVGCHGSSGEGRTGPALAGLAIERDQARSIVRNGFGGMPAFGSTLDDGDIDAIVAFALAIEGGEEPTTSTSTTTTMVLRSGPELYAEHCASCHGDDAEGAIGPPLTERELTEGAIRDVVTSGRGSMPSFDGVLTSDGMSALVDFVETLAKPPPGTAATAAGADLYAHQCAACHGADGRGSLGPSLRTTQLEGSELRAAIVQGNATMPAFGFSLESRELDVITEFVEWLKRTDRSIVTLRGGPAIYGQDCAGCHGRSGEGGVGPALRDLDLTVNEIVARVYGGHEAGMPAFAGALDGQQVRDVAQYIKRFEPGPQPDEGVDVFLVAAIVLGAGAAAFAGLILVSRSRDRRRAT